MSIARRRFLKTVLSGTTIASLGMLDSAFAAAGPAIASTKINDQLTLFSGAGANVVAARDADALALVDGGLAEHSGALLKAVGAAMGTTHVHTLFNTHWHPEQTGSNERLAREGATIISHENTRLWLGYANPVPGTDHTYGPLPPKARPTKTFFYDSVKTTVGGDPVEYGYLLQAHTDGDIYVYFRKSNVLVTGGAVSGAGWPIIDYKTGGWLLGMVAGLRTLIALADADTRIVPANGPLLTRADLQAQLAMYSTISDRLTKMLRQGLGPDEAIARAPTKEFDAKWGDSRQFITLAFRSLWGHFAPDA